MSFFKTYFLHFICNIFAFCAQHYTGCLWPEGYMDKEHCYVFDHEDIDCLFYIGLQDIEEFNFRFELDEMMKKMGH